MLAPEDVPAPEPGPGQALIAVDLANVTFVETQVRAGRAPEPRHGAALPAIPGNGVGGRVEAVGPGVEPGLVGRRVVTSTGGRGAYAERVAVDAGGLLDVPDGLSLRDAVALLADGRTALGLVRQAAPAAGETVLVEAAAGGVGSLLVQLAAAAGARVVALAGGPDKLALAPQPRGGRRDRLPRPGVARGGAQRRRGGGVDVVFDGVGGDVGRAAFELVRPGGRFVAFGLASGAFTRVDDAEAGARGVVRPAGFGGSPADLLELTRAALAEGAAGRLRPVVGQTFALEDAAAAHAAIESRATVGKTLLVVRPGADAGLSPTPASARGSGRAAGRRRPSSPAARAAPRPSARRPAPPPGRSPQAVMQERSLPQPGRSSKTGSAWWKSDWCSGKSSVTEPSRSR